MPLVGQNPGNIRSEGNKFTRVDTELLGGEKAARQLYKRLAGKPPSTTDLRTRDTLNDGTIVQFRLEGKSGHPKVDITRTLKDGRQFIEKVSFKE